MVVLGLVMHWRVLWLYWVWYMHWRNRGRKGLVDWEEPGLVPDWEALLPLLALVEGFAVVVFFVEGHLPLLGQLL